ncbi:MAG: TIGR01777 family protein [Gammaproteobacteria bacterium]|nr:TIGR01777 family protein [Gammaproteobacteria bacterium]
MKVFITGITGLIGQSLVQALLKQNCTVSGLTRNADKAAKKLPKSVSLVESLEDANDFMPDVVINLAGAPIADKRWSKSRKKTLMDSRVALTKQLVSWMSELRQAPEVFISGSAVGFYGRQGKKKIDESSKPHDEFTHQLCHEWEAAALEAESFSRVCLLRTGLVVAPNGGFLSKMLLPFKLGLGGRLGNGQQMMSWIHIDDMVNGILHLIEHNECSGAFNFTAPNPVSNDEFSKTLGNVLNRPVIFPVPAFVLKTMLGEMSDLLLTGQNVIPKRLKESGFWFEYTELEEALKKVLNK